MIFISTKRRLVMSSALVLASCVGPEGDEAQHDQARISAAPPACAIPDSSSSGAVRYLYCQVLGREPKPQEVTTQVARLDGYSTVRRFVLRDLMLSQEFATASVGTQQAAMTVEQKVEKAYAVLLRQRASPEDVTFWANWVRQRTFEALVLDFTTRTQFFSSHPKALFEGCAEARLRSLVDSGKDAALFLEEECIAWTPPDSAGRREVRLAAGTYTLGRILRVAQPGGLVVRTLGLPPETRCGATGARCAVLRANDDFLRTDANDADHEYLVQVLQPGVVFDGLVIDGNKDARFAAWLARGKPALQWNGTLHVAQSDFEIRNSVVKNTLKGSAMLLGGKNHLVERNLFASNGRHATGGWWADGVTTSNVDGSVLRDNDFVDNTDIQLIFGGCRGCNISNNRFRHSGDPQGASWAELMFQAWPSRGTASGTSGDFTGTVAEANSMDCSEKRLCSFGILVGNESWAGWPELAGGAPAFGMTIRNNDVRRAILGINVDRATGPITMYGNRVSESGGRYLHTSNTAKDGERLHAWLWSGAINVSPSSLPYVRAQDGSSRLDFGHTVSSYAEMLTLMPTAPPPHDPSYTGPDDFLRDAEIKSLSSTPAPGTVNLQNVSPPQTEEEQVAVIYLQILGRYPDPGGLAYWASRLRSGSSVSAVAEALVHSAELTKLHPIVTMSPERLVAIMYQLALRRVPDAGGYRFWLGRLASGATSRDAFIAQMLASPEFLGQFASVGR